MADIYSQNPKLQTITNRNDMSVTVMDWGATIISIQVPLKDGTKREALLGVADPQDWHTQACYFNATIGRYANRIAESSFTLNGREYKLNSADRHCLHGGIEGFDKRRYTFTEVKPNALTCTIHSADGDQGFPGNFDLKVIFTLTDDNKLTMAYEAVCDQACPACITNHAYFNLNGCNSTILGHTLKLNSTEFLELDALSIPTGRVISVKDMPAFDFTAPKTVGRDFLTDEQQKAALGYDHPFLCSGNGDEAIVQATGEDGRLQLEVFTDYPAFQFYSGNYIHAGTPIIARDDGREYPNQAGFCFEPEFYPDAPHQPQLAARNPIVEPGKPLKRFIAYKFTAL